MMEYHRRKNKTSKGNTQKKFNPEVIRLLNEHERQI